MKLQVAPDELGFDDLPDGDYHIIITDGEVRETSDESKHPENDYWNVEMTVQDGPLAGRKDWTNVMLPPYKLYTLANIVVAAGYSKDDLLNGNIDVELFEEDLDDPDDEMALALVGLELIVRIKTKTKNGRENRNHRFLAYDADAWDAEDGDLSP